MAGENGRAPWRIGLLRILSPLRFQDTYPIDGIGKKFPIGYIYSVSSNFNEVDSVRARQRARAFFRLRGTRRVEVDNYLLWNFAAPPWLLRENREVDVCYRRQPWPPPPK